MNIKDFDLNLLKCFDAIARHSNVSSAANELGISQGGMSAALRRLRAAFGDPLFVRASVGMKATPLAERLAPKIASWLTAVGEFDRPPRFTPDTTTIDFNVYINDVGLMGLLPHLLERLRKAAPRARITVADLRPDEVIRALDQGRVDVAVGYFPDVPGWARQQKLRESTFVCVVRADHPVIRDQITLAQFLEAEHVSYWSNDGLFGMLDVALRRHKLAPKVSARVPRFAAILSLIGHADYVVTVPEDFGWMARRIANVKLLRPPFSIERFVVKQYWHERLNADPAHVWFRAVLKREAEGLPKPTY